MGNTLITIGIIIIAVGIVFNIFSRFNIPLLPGDILIQKENFTFYFPIVTAIIISVILSFIFNLFR